MKQHEINIVRMKAVIKRLGPLAENIMFVGGAVMGFLLSDPAAAEVRPTKDIDVTTNVASRTEYNAQEQTLRTLGIHNNQEGTTCGFKFEDPELGEVLIDFMPTDEQVLLLKNNWYKPAFANAMEIDLGDDIVARIISAPYFLATKLEAFADRGKQDYYASSDMSDIIQLVDGRPELLDEIDANDTPLKMFLRASLESLLADARFQECIEGHLRHDSTSRERAELVLDRIKGLLDKVSKDIPES